MMHLKLLNADLASVFGLPAQDTDTDAIITEYAARGWRDADVMRHIDAAIQAGAFARVETKYPERKERIVRAGDAGEK